MCLRPFVNNMSSRSNFPEVAGDHNEQKSASRNPVGKLIRSGNPEEFDAGLPLHGASPSKLIRAIYASDYR